MERRRMPTWLVSLVAACGLFIAFFDHSFLRGTASTLVLVCAITLIVVAIAWDRWSRP